MSTNRFTSWSAVRVAFATVAVSSLAIIGACSEGSVASSVAGPSVRLGQSTGPGIANASIAKVCVTGPVGTYNFVNANDSTGPGGTTVYNQANGVPYSLIVTLGNPTPCVDVVTRTALDNPNALSDAFSAATVTQTSGPAGTVYSTTNCVDDPGVAISNPCALSARIHANKFHGSQATFVNTAAPATTGCTYTFGWYKNQGNATVPSSSFFGTAWSWKTVLAFKGQGNLYYTLADQYIPAKLNGGSTGPIAVQQAITAAETFFTGRALGSTTGYSTTTLNAIIKTVNDFNDGLSGGWPHCG